MVQDFETEFGVKDAKHPDLVMGEESFRIVICVFEISECNVMSCVGSFGKLREFLGIPILPLMTVYDFFIKRALDQYFYNLYWKSSFVVVGTPAGVTLSPEKVLSMVGNQIYKFPIRSHGNLSFLPKELDWILCDAIKHAMCNTTMSVALAF